MATMSKNVYRIPFEAGTEVRVSRDHLTHTPPTRIDLGRVGATPGKVVAAADGVIRFIVDKFSENRSGQTPCNNNYVWIEHADNEWTKYSHLTKNSVTGTAGLSVGDNVKAGAFLGTEGDVGCANGVHLHWEVFVPVDPKNPIDAEGFGIGGSANNRIPRMCGLPGQIFVAGQTYTSTNLVAGAKEFARHGISGDRYQMDFDAATNCGYRLRWIDGYADGSSARFNAIFEPNTPAQRWSARHGLTGADYQKAFDDFAGQGFRLTHVDASAVGGAVRYAAIFAKVSGPRMAAYHGKTADEHQERFDELTAKGFTPRVVSVASVNGQRSYAALYLEQSIGSFQARSFLTPTEYQRAFDANAAAGRRLTYLNSYTHNGSPRLTAIWASNAQSAVRARHGMTSSEYQSEWEEARKAGLTTRAVTGYEDGGKTRFAAYWAK